MAVTFTSGDTHLYSANQNLPNTASPFSVNAWLNAQWSSGNRISMVGLYDGAAGSGTPTTGAGLQLGTTGAGDITCWTYGGSTKVAGTGMTAYNGAWVMITYVYAGANTHLLYRNGVLLSTAVSSFIPQQMTQVYLNGYPPSGNSSETANFSIDAYQCFTRAISADEVLTLYNNEGSRGGLVAQSVSQFDFDELPNGSLATSIRDLSGSSAPLQFIGATNTSAYTYGSNIANSNLQPVL